MQRVVFNNRFVFALGLGVAVFYWLTETLMHHWVFDPSMSFLCCLFPDDPNELWMRISGFLTITIFGFIAQLLFNKLNALHKAKRETQTQLEEILTKTLSGYIPICAGCKKIVIRTPDKEDRWVQVESYVSDHSTAKFSHTLCPDCNQRVYGQFLKKDR